MGRGGLRWKQAPDIPLADLAKLCKGTQKIWPDGKNFTLVIKDPESPEMKVAIQKLFGACPNEVKAMIAKLNELRQVVKNYGQRSRFAAHRGSDAGSRGNCGRVFDQ